MDDAWERMSCKKSSLTSKRFDDSFWGDEPFLTLFKPLVEYVL